MIKFKWPLFCQNLKFYQMALFYVRVDPIFEWLLYQENQTGCHKICLPVLNWHKNMEVYPYTLTKINLHFLT